MRTHLAHSEHLRRAIKPQLFIGHSTDGRKLLRVPRASINGLATAGRDAACHQKLSVTFIDIYSRLTVKGNLGKTPSFSVFAECSRGRGSACNGVQETRDPAVCNERRAIHGDILDLGFLEVRVYGVVLRKGIWCLANKQTKHARQVAEEGCVKVARIGALA